MITKIIECKNLNLSDLSKHNIKSILKIANDVESKRLNHFYLDTEYLDARTRPWFDEICQNLKSGIRGIYTIEMLSATVFGQGSVVSESGYVIFDSIAEFYNHGLPPDGSKVNQGELEIGNIATARQIAGRSLLVKRPWYRNHGHWLIDLTPIIGLAKQAGVIIDNIIFGDVLTENTRAMMLKAKEHCYPDANVISMTDDEVLVCEKLHYMTPVHVPPFFQHPVAVAESSNLSKANFPTSGKPAHSKIYVSRSLAANRKVLNEGEIENFLVSKKYEIIYPEKMSISEQISKFEEASIVISVKGAALTNCIFCTEGTHIISLTPSRFPDPFFWNIASHQKAQYSEIFCKEAPYEKDPGPPNTNIIVDLKKLEKALQRVEDNLANTRAC